MKKLREFIKIVHKTHKPSKLNKGINQDLLCPEIPFPYVSESIGSLWQEWNMAQKGKARE